MFLELNGISKKFNNKYAINNLTFDIKEGEIIGIYGNNGAGKTTLINVLSGIYTFDEGYITLNGGIRFQKSKDYRQDINRHISVVHQHNNQVGNMSVVENVALGSILKKPYFLMKNTIRAELEELNQKYSLGVNLDAKIKNLSMSMAQKSEILCALYANKDFIIIDEGFFFLSKDEKLVLKKVLKSMREEGKTIILISHNFEEIRDLTTRNIIMEKGKIVYDSQNGDNDLILEKYFLVEPVGVKNLLGPKLGNFSNYFVQGRKHKLKIDKLDLHEGEIIVFEGLKVNESTLFIEALLGIKKHEGYLEFKDEQRENNIIGYIPGNRHKKGLFLEENIEFNILGKKILRNQNITKLSRKSKKSLVEKLMDEYGVSTLNYKVLSKRLSGGNQQKLLIGRELSINPSILIIEFPTRGIDPQGRDNIWKILLDGCKQGLSIILFTNELNEIHDYTHRVCVFNEGEMVEIMDSGLYEERV